MLQFFNALSKEAKERKYKGLYFIYEEEKEPIYAGLLNGFKQKGFSKFLQEVCGNQLLKPSIRVEHFKSKADFLKTMQRRSQFTETALQPFHQLRYFSKEDVAKIVIQMSQVRTNVAKGTPKKQKERVRQLVTRTNGRTVNAYVDGSYLPRVQIGAYGFVMEEEEGAVITKDFGLVRTDQLRSLGSLGAELQGCLSAIEWAIANEYEAIRIFYDFEGIIAAIQNNEDAEEKVYLQMYETYADFIQIYFRKVRNDGREGKQHLVAHDLSGIAKVIHQS